MIFAAILIALQSASEPQASPAPAPPACDSAAHSGFDFWVGEWEVFAAANPQTKVAESRIERKHVGCAVIEHWMPLNGRGGTSLNHFDASDGRWHQKWVGSSPGAVAFSGGVVDGRMVLTGNWPTPAAPHTLVRMTYTADSTGSVRQHGESSTDHGVSWQTSFDFFYRPKKDSSK